MWIPIYVPIESSRCPDKRTAEGGPLIGRITRNKDLGLQYKNESRNRLVACRVDSLVSKLPGCLPFMA
jgi:hypothetical protein